MKILDGSLQTSHLQQIPHPSNTEATYTTNHDRVLGLWIKRNMSLLLAEEIQSFIAETGRITMPKGESKRAITRERGHENTSYLQYRLIGTIHLPAIHAQVLLLNFMVLVQFAMSKSLVW